MALCDSTNSDNALDIHSNRLDGMLKAWNFKHVPVSGDGNFYAVGHLLHKRNCQHVLQSLGCSTESNPKELSKALRQATVSEWLGENSLHYQSFLTHDQLHEEEQKFIEDGHYSGDMGDPCSAC